MNGFVLDVGWRMHQKSLPYILMCNLYEKKEILTNLIPNNPISIKVKPLEPKFCVGFNNAKGEMVPCPTSEIIPLNKAQCQKCTLSQFFTCKSLCHGDFCNPSSEEAREHCWKTKTYVYLTFISGRIKVGTSANPLRRWLEQGSDAGICIGEGIGLDPRSLEYQIGTNFSLPFAIRTNEKIKSLNKKIDRKSVEQKLNSKITEISSSLKSEILYPIERLEKITFLENFYGGIHNINSRPLVCVLNERGLEISGTIIGVKGLILIVKNVETFYATNINSLIGININLTSETNAMLGQKSLADFFKSKN